MAVDRYVSTFTVTLNAGQTLAFPHFLVANGQAATPTTVLPDRATEIVCTVAGATTATFNNPTAGPLTAVFIATFIHSINRAPSDMPNAPVLWKGANPVSPGGAGFALWSDATALASDPIVHVPTEFGVWLTFQEGGGDQGVLVPANTNAGLDGTVLQIEGAFSVPTEGVATVGYQFLVQGQAVGTVLLGGGENYAGLAYVQVRVVWNADGGCLVDGTVHYTNNLGPAAIAKLVYPEQTPVIDPTLPAAVVAQVQWLDPDEGADEASMVRLSARVFQGHPPPGP